MAISINPDNSITWTNKGYALITARRISEAMAAFDTALKLNPLNEDARAGKAMAIRTIYPQYEGR
jgi:cytochrome c-type biogenesis protein CcmH/NrfG